MLTLDACRAPFLTLLRKIGQHVATFIQRLHMSTNEMDLNIRWYTWRALTGEHDLQRSSVREDVKAYMQLYPGHWLTG